MDNQGFYLIAGAVGATVGLLSPIYRVCVNHIDKTTGETKYFQSVYNWRASYSFLPYIWHDGVNYLCQPFFIVGNKMSHDPEFAKGDLQAQVTTTKQTFVSSILFGSISVGVACLYKFLVKGM